MEDHLKKLVSYQFWRYLVLHYLIILVSLSVYHILFPSNGNHVIFHILFSMAVFVLILQVTDTISSHRIQIRELSYKLYAPQPEDVITISFYQLHNVLILSHLIGGIFYFWHYRIGLNTRGIITGLLWFILFFHLMLIAVKPELSPFFAGQLVDLSNLWMEEGKLIPQVFELFYQRLKEDYNDLLATGQISMEYHPNKIVITQPGNDLRVVIRPTYRTQLILPQIKDINQYLGYLAVANPYNYRIRVMNFLIDLSTLTVSRFRMKVRNRLNNQIRANHQIRDKDELFGRLPITSFHSWFGPKGSIEFILSPDAIIIQFDYFSVSWSLEDSFATQSSMILKPLHQSTNVCHICYQPITTSPELETPCCMTTFHHIHLMEWLQQYESCPHCRFVLTTDIMTTILAHNPLS